MRRPFLVSHPVPYRFVPRRGRHERFGFGTSTVDVSVDELGEEPRLLGTAGKAGVFAADGAAWMAAESPTTGIGIGEEGLRRVLSDAAPGSDPELAPVANYLVRSPLCYSRVTAQNYARGNSIARGGDLAPAQLGAVIDDGSERAAQDVRDFVADRIKLHRGHVFLRYEGIALHAIDLKGGHASHLSIRPRTELGTAWYAATRTVEGEAEATGGLPEFPGGLLRDDDAVWFLNAYAHRMAEAARVAAAGRDRFPAVVAAREYFVALGPEIARLERDTWTSSLSGDRLQPALVTLGRALWAAHGYAVAQASERGDEVAARQAEAYDLAGLMLRNQVLPRLLDAIPTEDRDGLACLAP